jgi:thymidylate kinase
MEMIQGRIIFFRREQEKFQNMAELAPDLVIKLHVPNEVAANRKPDHNVDNIHRKAEITQKIKFNGSKVDINASKPIEEVLDSTKKEVWESL